MKKLIELFARRQAPQGATPRASGTYVRPRQLRACTCGERYGADAWPALPLVGRISVIEEDDDEEPDLRPIELRQCPRCHRVIAAREPKGRER